MTDILKAKEVPYSLEKSSSCGSGTCGGGSCAPCCYDGKTRNKD